MFDVTDYLTFEGNTSIRNCLDYDGSNYFIYSSHVSFKGTTNIYGNNFYRDFIYTSGTSSYDGVNGFYCEGDTTIQSNLYGRTTGAYHMIYISSSKGIKFGKGKTSFYSNAQNLSTTDGALIYSPSTMVLEDGADLSFRKNRLSVNTNNALQFIYIDGGSGIDMKGNSRFEMVENEMYTYLNTNTTKKCLINLASGRKFSIASGSICIKDNITTGSYATHANNHFYGVISSNTACLIEQKPGYKMDTINSRIDLIFFTPTDGKGTIYKNWTKDTVQDWTKNRYKEVFTADTFIHKELYVDMYHDDVVIRYAPHVHKSCGIATDSICQHIGIASHSDAIEYDPWGALLGSAPTKGYYYLEKDYAYSGYIGITGNMYICLNGFSITNLYYRLNDNANNYHLYITNCSTEKNSTINSYNQNRMFEHINLHVISNEVKKIICRGNSILYNNYKRVNEFYNVDLTKNSSTNTQTAIFYMSGDTVKLTVSKCILYGFTINNSSTYQGDALFNMLHSKSELYVYDSEIYNIYTYYQNQNRIYGKAYFKNVTYRDSQGGNNLTNPGIL